MRTALFTVATMFALAAPAAAHARTSTAAPTQTSFKAKSKKKKKKKKKKKRTSGGGGDAGTPDASSPLELPNGVDALLRGSGQRLSFTFAGKIWTREGTTRGAFFLAFHPQSPASDVVHISCRYDQFSDVDITDARSSFRMSGRCRQIFVDGRMVNSDVTNDVIINNNATDSVSIQSVGSGLSVPPGSLSFGDFAMTSRSEPSS